MNNDGHKSQISAWFDDELTVAERAAVDQAIERSADARDELAEYRQISEWLTEMPRETLPSEFGLSVMESARRPVAQAAIDNSPRLRPNSGEAPHSVRWTQGVGIILTTAAMLFIALTLFDGRHRDDSAKQRWPVAVNSKSEESKLANEADFNESSNSRGPVDDVIAENELNNQLGRMPTVASRPMAGGSAALAESPFASERIANRDAPAGGLTFRGNLKNAEIGEIVEAMEANAGQVTVVRLTVVDRLEGAGLKQLRVLLSRNHIPRESAAKSPVSSGPETDAETAKSAPGKEGERLVAVYVEATGDQLTSVLEQIRREKHFQEINVDRPISIAQLDKATPQPLGGYARANRRIRSRAFSSAAAAAPGEARKAPVRKPAPTDSPNDNADKNKKNGATPKNALEQKKQLELERISRQLQLSLTADMLADKSVTPRRGKNKTSVALAEGQGAKRRKDGEKQDEPADDKRNIVRQRKPHLPLHVLFVLEIVPTTPQSKPDDGAA